MVFGSLDPLYLSIFQRPHSAKELLYGSQVASDSLYQAILRYGSFTEFHFFVNDAQKGQVFSKRIKTLCASPQKVKVIPVSQLPVYFSRTKYALFFSADFSLAKLAALRSRYAKEPFPICGVAHNISFSHLLRWVFFDNMLADIHSYDSIICTSKAASRAFRNLHHLLSAELKQNRGISINYGGRIEQLPLGVNPDEFKDISKGQARSRLGLPKDKVILLYFGRFSLYDKADLYPLLLMLQKLRADKSNILLLLAGVDAQDGYGTALKSIAKKMNLCSDIKFIFSNCLREKALIYAASDIFLSPADNLQETFGLTVLEAMAAALPVVASDWNGYKDLVIPNQTGFRVPTYWIPYDNGLSYMNTVLNFWWQDHLQTAQSVAVDTDALTRYVARLVNNKQLRLRLGNNAKELVAAEFSWNKLIPRYEALWRRMLKISKVATPVKKKEIFLIDYLKSFGHYPTKILNSHTLVQITESGRDFLKSKRLVSFIPESLTGLLSLRVIFILLSFAAGRKVITIATLQRETGRFFNEQLPSQTQYAIAWMLKKGLLSLGKKRPKKEAQ
jgi:glycosyltransferase involved in cell wall biosynthesis